MSNFVPPPYPYDRLNGLREIAASVPGGVVDCSVGTPCDPPPEMVIQALHSSGTERSYPSSAGSPAFRRACADWLDRRFAVKLNPSEVSSCIGTKEMVASLAGLLHLRDASRDTVLFPEVSYPTYEMSARLAGLRAVAVPPLTSDGTGVDLERVSKSDVERSLVLWVNSPSNPTGGMSDLKAVAAWGRHHNVSVFSDECYAEFTWDGPPRTILESGLSGVVAVHSLSKRSNMAGLRVGFFAGDPELVGYLRDVRQHAGLMVPGPVQAAATVAICDDSHVELQRYRYFERLEFLADVLSRAGFNAALPAGGFYLWAKVPERFGDAWSGAEHLARAGGLLVSPGDLYGHAARGYLRIATVQPMSRLEVVAERMEAASGSHG